MLFLLLTPSSQAAAEPFRLIAKYNPSARDKTSKPIVVALSDGETIPQSSIDHEFLGIFLEPKGDDYSKLLVSKFRNTVVSTHVGQQQHPPIDRSNIKGTPQEAVQVLNPAHLGSKHSVEHLWINIRSKLSVDALCAEETRLRMALDKPLVQTPDVLTADAKSAKDRMASDMVAQHALRTDDGLMTFFSFCKPLAEVIDWSKVEKAFPITESERKQYTSTKDAHKHRLSALVVESLKKSAGFEAAGVARDDAERPENVVVETTYQIYLLKAVGDFQLSEVDSSQERRLATLVGADSRLDVVVDGASSVCIELPNGCNDFVEKRITTIFEAVTADGKTSSKEAVMVPLNDTAWSLSGLDLDKHVGDKLTFRVFFNAEGDDRLELVNGTVKVERLGLVTTFPVLTDVVTALSSTSPSNKEIAKKSSIPLSWAINLSSRSAEAAHIAITFPWMLALSPRWAPNLADYVKVFPHLSIIVPLESDTAIKSPRPAFGVGIALANAFTFSLGWTVKDPQRFLLIGVSITDLAQFLKGPNSSEDAK